MTTSSWLIWASCDSRNSAFVSTLACGKAAIAASTAASPSSGVTPSASLAATKKSRTVDDGLAYSSVSREISQLPAIEASA